MSPISLSADSLGTFFDARHRALGDRLREILPGGLTAPSEPAVVARDLGVLGLYRWLVPEALGGEPAGKPNDELYVDVRNLVTIREALGQVCPLGDAIYAVQGLGSYPIAVAGSKAQREHFLPGVLTGDRIGAFALTEPEAGTDVASLRTQAKREGASWVIDGDKTLISNVGIATHYVVFANADPALGRKGISVFVVDAATPGLSTEPQSLSSPHPLGRIRFSGCRVSDEMRLGEVGRGFSLALETLDAFRISVGAAANGMAARALAETLSHVTRRKQFGAPLAELQTVQAYVAEMATELDAARLLVARAAHLRDTAGGRVTVEAAMAKMFATEAAQRIIDKAVQLHGGMGVLVGSEVEALYRDIRPLRIYEGTTEIQKIVIARALLSKR